MARKREHVHVTYLYAKGPRYSRGTAPRAAPHGRNPADRRAEARPELPDDRTARDAPEGRPLHHPRATRAGRTTPPDAPRAVLLVGHGRRGPLGPPLPARQDAGPDRAVRGREPGGRGLHRRRGVPHGHEHLRAGPRLPPRAP